jgi:hypothetical protein
MPPIETRLVDDLIHLYRRNGVELTIAEAEAELADPANHDIVVAVRYAPATVRRSWRQAVAVATTAALLAACGPATLNTSRMGEASQFGLPPVTGTPTATASATPDAGMGTPAVVAPLTIEPTPDATVAPAAFSADSAAPAPNTGDMAEKAALPTVAVEPAPTPLAGGQP